MRHIIIKVVTKIADIADESFSSAFSFLFTLAKFEIHFRIIKKICIQIKNMVAST